MRIADVHKIDNSIFKTRTHLISDHELHSYIFSGPSSYSKSICDAEISGGYKSVYLSMSISSRYLELRTW